MIKREDFQRWFNRDFWKAFKNRAFPIKIPATQKEKNELVEKVYASISSARYSPSIPEAEIVAGTGFGFWYLAVQSDLHCSVNSG